jgi:NAD+ kinase
LKKQPKNIRRIGLVANDEKIAGRSIVQKAADMIRAAGRSVLADSATAKMAGLNVPACKGPADVARQVDLLMVFGGDGTFLRAARDTAGCAAPLIGINIGGLGFLTDVQSHQLPLALEQIWEGKTILETRPLIEALGTASGRKVADLAVNDFVVTRGASPRLIELEVSVDDEMLTRFRCDGIIICSPTGSTAYSLAAGGAIINPAAAVMELTPICAHTLSNRSVIISLESTVTVKVLSERVQSVLTADGQPPTPLAAGDIIRIRRSKHSVRLLHLAGSSFFGTLRTKLGWVGGHV